MRQVPTYLVIGHGRVARHFLHYFKLLGISAAHWHRGMDASELQDAERILVLVSDRAIDSVIDERLSALRGMKIHFSGALVTPKAFGAHPLMTFGPDLYTLEKYTSIPFVIDDAAPADVLPELPNPQARLAPNLKAKYHAMCVMSGNFTCLLWQKMFDTMQREFNLPPEMAHMYMRQVMENLSADYKTALTGPLARGDDVTIAKNIAALDGDAYQKIYQSFVDVYKETTSS